MTWEKQLPHKNPSWESKETVFILYMRRIVRYCDIFILRLISGSTWIILLHKYIQNQINDNMDMKYWLNITDVITVCEMKEKTGRYAKLAQIYKSLLDNDSQIYSLLLLWWEMYLSFIGFEHFLCV